MNKKQTIQKISEIALGFGVVWKINDFFFQKITQVIFIMIFAFTLIIIRNDKRITTTALLPLEGVKFFLSECIWSWAVASFVPDPGIKTKERKKYSLFWHGPPENKYKKSGRGNEFFSGIGLLRTGHSNPAKSARVAGGHTVHLQIPFLLFFSIGLQQQ